MKKNPDLTEALLDCWKTTNHVSVYLISIISPNLWSKKIPGYPRKTVGMLMVHLHNARLMWINAIEKEKSTEKLKRLNTRATKSELMIAMKQSSKAMLTLLQRCIEHGGALPARPAWLNFPNDVVHLLAYFVAHEAHHRGQVIMAARQLGQPFERGVAGELWRWRRRNRESRRKH